MLVITEMKQIRPTKIQNIEEEGEKVRPGKIEEPADSNTVSIKKCLKN